LKRQPLGNRPGIIQESIMDEYSSIGTPRACHDNLAPGAGRSSDEAFG